MQVRTLQGHTNERNFVGLTVNNEYIACGSETNEVFVYHKVILVLFLCDLICTVAPWFFHFIHNFETAAVYMQPLLCSWNIRSNVYSQMHSPLQVIVLTDIVIFWFVALGNLKTSLPA